MDDDPRFGPVEVDSGQKTIFRSGRQSNLLKILKAVVENYFFQAVFF